MPPRAAWILLAAMLCGSSVIGAQAAEFAEDFCVVPVEDGQPTEADLGHVYRMVSRVETIPRLDQLFIQPLNRGGRWTVDRQGHYRPFEGDFPTRSLRTEWTVDGSGRVIGASGRDLYVIDPGDNRFRHLLAAKDFGVRHIWRPVYEPQTDTVYVTTSQGLYELRGGQLVRSPFAIEAAEAGLPEIFPPRYLPAQGIHLAETADHSYALRRQDGYWQKIYGLKCDRPFCRNYPSEYASLEDGKLQVILTAKELLAIDLSDPEAPRVIEIHHQNGNLPRRSARYSEETDSYLIYDTKIFAGVANDPAFPAVSPDGSWLLRVTREGVHPVPGARIVPKQDAKGRFSNQGFVDLPGEGKVLVFAGDGLAIFDGTSVREIPDSGPADIGRYPRAHVLASIGRVIVASDEGLFELTEDDRLVELAPPFPTKQLPQVVLADVPHLGIAIALTKEGVHVLDKEGAFHRVTGGDNLKLGFLSTVLDRIPGTDDVLLQAQDSLYLFSNRLCAR